MLVTRHHATVRIDYTLVYQTHMTVEDDGPYESEDDGWPSLCDIWDVYVHQFDLVERKRSKLNKLQIQCFYLLQFLCFLCKLTDFFLRKSSAVSMLALCWKTPRPFCLFCGDKSQQQRYYKKITTWNLSQNHGHKLTRGWPLITSSRLSSCEPSLRSEKMSDTNVGGHLCKDPHH